MAAVRIVAVVTALLLFVYFGATTADTHVGVIAATVQATLESEMELEWG